MKDFYEHLGTRGDVINKNVGGAGPERSSINHL
jgi:hypothetical protein